MQAILTSRWAKILLFSLSMVPLAELLWRAVHNDLGANPVERLQHATGDWTLRFLVFTLCVTPVRTLVKLPELVRFRRMLGLFAFFYACLHFLTYLGPDQNFDLGGMGKDVFKRPFITVGFLGFILLVPLAVTSTAGWIRRLGGKRWQSLHRAVYLSALAGVIHYDWLVKSDRRKPLLYGAIVGALLLWRVAAGVRKRGRNLAARANGPEPRVGSD